MCKLWREAAQKIIWCQRPSMNVRWWKLGRGWRASRPGVSPSWSIIKQMVHNYRRSFFLRIWIFKLVCQFVTCILYFHQINVDILGNYMQSQNLRTNLVVKSASQLPSPTKTPPNYLWIPDRFRLVLPSLFKPQDCICRDKLKGNLLVQSGVSCFVT